MSSEWNGRPRPWLRSAVDLTIGAVLAAGLLLNADIVTGIPNNAAAVGPDPECGAPCGCPDGTPAECCGNVQYCADGSVCQGGGGPGGM